MRWLLLLTLLAGCPGARKAGSEPRPTPPGDLCEQFCTDLVACKDQLRVEDCVAECRTTRRQATFAAPCATATDNRYRCVRSKSCEDKDAFFTGSFANGLDYPCARENKLFTIYCTPSPATNACLQDCSTAKGCDENQRTLDDCAVDCGDDLMEKLRQYGPQCMTATVESHFCSALASCSQRKNFSADGESGTCAAQVNATNVSCR